ncbi:hypothetical protein AK830_g7538 [Neonectria ditissima]|uniref:Uncharacterized protein n=1 Tax=Neonectria ditissima TaxID=78410 RepID=A0A0P7BEJ8_9HYPO|nr:hypothetical protein AK830_g7538 [Neonectria ditissima]
MSLALSTSARLKPDIRLAQAVSQFEADLLSDQKAAFRTLRSKACDRPPGPDDVMCLTAEIDRRAAQNGNRMRCVGPRLTNTLQAIQQIVGLGDIVVGGSQNMVACGVWSLVRTSLLLVTNHAAYLEKISVLFMNAGRSAPRYQQMALLYPRSKSLQGDICEYLTVVVHICHEVLRLSQKSYVAQLLATLSDERVKQYQIELETWSASIKEEVNLLMVQNMENEAKESHKFRVMTSKLSEMAAHRKTVKERLRILDACSTFDYQTPWKQARKVGNTDLLVEQDQYKEWRGDGNSRTLVCNGKLGAGKSVLLANIVDDLNLYSEKNKFPVAYFFCRHDIPESLQPRTVIGSLVRQLLSTVFDLKSLPLAMDRPRNQKMSVEQLLDYFYIAFKPQSHCYFVLDGLDECLEADRQTLLALCVALQQRLQLNLCVSFRLEADNRIQQSLDQFDDPAVLTIPEENPDIVAFIDAELKARIHEDKLNIGDPNFILEIRDALLTGAQGMFLWVALQISSLCAERTDEKIRNALQDMPKDLSETFSRILKRAAAQDTGYQQIILQLVAVAYRPLAAEELREALSVTPGNTDWDPAKLVNNIYSTLACCGSLITVDEEERTIRLVHHSVKQYLVGDFRNDAECSFDLEDANRRMGQSILTYLNYNVFETQLSTAVIPEIYTGSATRTIIKSLQTSKRSQSIALKLLTSRLKQDAASQPNYNIGQTLANQSKRFRNQTTQHSFAFHSYAKTYWLFHTTSIPESDGFSHHALVRLLEQEPLDLLSSSWDRAECNRPPMGALLPNSWRGTQNLQLGQVSSGIYWALQNSHLPLFRYELKNEGIIRTILSIFASFDTFLLQDTAPVWHKDMCTQLLPFAALHRSTSWTRFLLAHGASVSYQNYCSVASAISSRSLPVLKLLFKHIDKSESLKDIIHDLEIDAVLEASRGENGNLVCFLVRMGADVNRYTGQHSPLFYILTHIRTHAAFPKAAEILILAGARLECPIKCLTIRGLLLDLWDVRDQPVLIESLIESLGMDQCSRIFLDCCATTRLDLCGDETTQRILALTSLALYGSSDIDSCKERPEKHYISMDIELWSHGDPNLNFMLELLLQSKLSALAWSKLTSRGMLESCLIEKKSDVIQTLISYGFNRTTLRNMITELGLLHRRILELDYQEIETLCSCFNADINAPNLATEGVQTYGRTPLLTAIIFSGMDTDLESMALNLAFRGADLDLTGALGGPSPLQAVLHRLVCSRGGGAAFLRVARSFVNYGAQVDVSIVQWVIGLYNNAFATGQAERVPPGLRVNSMVPVLRQGCIDDCAVLLLERLLLEMMVKQSSSITVELNMLSSVEESMAARLSKSERSALFSSFQRHSDTQFAPPRLFLGRTIIIISLLAAQPTFETDLEAFISKLFKHVCAGIHRLPPVEWKCLQVPVYSLLKHGRRLHNAFTEASSIMPREKWNWLIEPGIHVAVAEGDIESVHAGRDMLISRDVVLDSKPIAKVQEIRQGLTSLPQEGVYYELESTPTDILPAMCEPIEPILAELPDIEPPGPEFLASKLVAQSDNVASKPNGDPEKKTKSRWWRTET